MVIRQAKTEDRSRISAADRICFPADEILDFQTDDVWWLALEKSQLAAYSGLRLMAPDYTVGYLPRMGVLPPFRGQGLQRRLTHKAIEYGKREGLTRLITYTNRFNLISTNNLLACGFRLYLPDFLWDQESYLYLRLDY